MDIETSCCEMLNIDFGILHVDLALSRRGLAIKGKINIQHSIFTYGHDFDQNLFRFQSFQRKDNNANTIV